jgi:hypothetical protein
VRIDTDRASLDAVIGLACIERFSYNGGADTAGVLKTRERRK